VQPRPIRDPPTPGVPAAALLPRLFPIAAQIPLSDRESIKWILAHDRVPSTPGVATMNATQPLYCRATVAVQLRQLGCPGMPLSHDDMLTHGVPGRMLPPPPPPCKAELPLGMMFPTSHMDFSRTDPPTIGVLPQISQGTDPVPVVLIRDPCPFYGGGHGR